MKKSLRSLIIIITALILSVPALTEASDMSLGVTTWYAWWDQDQKNNDSRYDPALMFGPALSITLPASWSITAVLLYGKFDETVYGSEFERYDSDFAINYGIISCLKIFAGMKYVYVDMNNGDGMHKVISPAAGIGLSIPLASSVYLIGNFSGLYGWGEEKGYRPTGDRFRSDLVGRGFNSTLSFAWYIDSMSTTLSLGGRYQRVWADYDKEYIANATHIFYGITFGAVYSFGL